MKMKVTPKNVKKQTFIYLNLKSKLIDQSGEHKIFEYLCQLYITSASCIPIRRSAFSASVES